MGDSTWVNITVKSQDLAKFNKLFFLSRNLYRGTWWDDFEIIKAPPTTFIQIHEANYGWETEFNMFAGKGLTFLGSNGDGSNYGNMETACFEGILVEVNADWENHPTVRYSENGVDQYDIDRVMNYWKIHKQVTSYFEEPPVPARLYQCLGCGDVSYYSINCHDMITYQLCINCDQISKMECIEGKPEEWSDLWQVRNKLLKGGDNL